MHRHARGIAAAIAVLIGIAACGDPTTPPAGTPAEVLVRAYVDADGTGTHSAGDPAIAGATVTLTPTQGGQPLSAVTGSDGVARFAAVPPGSYVAALSGDVPSGAVVSGPERPVVVVPFQGGTIDVDFRYVFHPGGFSGVVFRDDDGTGAYNPETDATAAGVEILAFRGTSIAGEPAASMVTGSDGAFEFTALRPGTYSVLVRIPAPLVQVGDSVHVVEVPAAGSVMLWPRFEGDFLISIAAARSAASGSTVTVEGVVLADQGTYQFQGRDTYIQDATAGIRLWDLDTSLGLEAGDSVQVTGVVGVNNDELQITVGELTVLGTGGIPSPRPVTGADIMTFQYDGQLAITGGVTVTGIQTFSFDAHSVTVEDAQGVSFVIRVESPNEIPSSYWEVGEVYQIRGVLGRFRATGQIKPRGFEDVTKLEAASDIATARALANGESVLVHGVVLADQGTYDFGNRDTYIQDATGGIRLWQLNTGLGLQAGDSIRVWGTLGTFNNERQLDVAGVDVLGTGTIPAPVQVTGADINAFTYDGQLGVTVPVTVVSVQGFSFDAHNVTVEDANGDRFLIRVDSPNEITTSYWQVGQSYRVTGVVMRFRQDGQIKPRSYADVEEL
jgi:DNA/RNA endonuclease YhcR with UshA esterase domain